jgi:CelD/BcsL family acetyltransferase involved in cellulose biosynthesis
MTQSTQEHVERSVSMEVELVSERDLDAAFRDWEMLFRVDDLATPFASPAWGRAWLEYWAPDAEPWLMRVHHGGRVAGVAPFALRRGRRARMLSMVGKEPGDYWDVIAAPADRESVAMAVGAELARRGTSWDAAVISCLPPESRTLEAFDLAGLRMIRRPPVASPAIALPDTFEAYLASLPRSHRSNLRRHLRRLDQREVVLREVTDAAEVPAVMRAWRELRSRQWKMMNRQLNPEHQADRFNSFMVEATKQLIDEQLTVLWEFSHDSRIAGIYLNFADAHRFYWYLGGFDPDLSALGLGKIAIGASLRASIEAGRRLYDFTRGDDAYKYWYGARDRMLASVVIGHGRARSRLALCAARARARGIDPQPTASARRTP